ncbi:basic salivary proline-rich protein 2-like [Ailuropoda melanoleuca]|uniref:basic salivary proline-rich protein 2-like n=1 Tax=Ailuropoda melanoleuca TaxID=9646 RepID=UPI0014944119|nr:basic salivary proline-rich protein 2-like [Ailuropoda melanoleuca]
MRSSNGLGRLARSDVQGGQLRGGSSGAPGSMRHSPAPLHKPVKPQGKESLDLESTAADSPSPLEPGLPSPENRPERTPKPHGSPQISGAQEDRLLSHLCCALSSLEGPHPSAPEPPCPPRGHPALPPPGAHTVHRTLVQPTCNPSRYAGKESPSSQPHTRRQEGLRSKRAWCPRSLKMRQTPHPKTKESSPEKGRRHEQTFLQRRRTNGQQTHEKILHISSPQGNSNQKHNEIPPHIRQNG